MAALEEARANSMRIYFGPGKKEPMELEIFNFMKQRMRLNPNSLLSMYKEPKEHCVYIKFKTKEMLTNTLLDLPESMDFEYSKYESTKVTFSPASTVFKYVRIFNLPPEINDQEISAVMSKFGVIQRMVREKYAPETGFPIWSSVRGVHMEIKQEIPATIHVRNFQARVFYDGLQNKCFLCGSKDHVKINCPKKPKVNQRMEQSGTLSYSAVAAQPERWMGKYKKNEESGGDGKMVVLNNRFTMPPPKLPELQTEAQNTNTKTITAKPTVEAEQSRMETLVSPASVPDADMVVCEEIAAAEGSGGEAASSSVPNPETVPEKEIAPVEKDGDAPFTLVESRRNKRDKRASSADSGAKASTVFIPPADLCAAQSVKTRGRLQQREVDRTTRSRSRSLRSRNLGGKGNEEGLGKEGEVEKGGRGEENLEKNL